MKKKCKVIMLPTDESNIENLSILNSKYGPAYWNGSAFNDPEYSGHYFYGLEKAKNFGYTPHHLYLVSDEDIKDNDHFMSAFYGYPLHNTKEWREQQKEMNGEYPDLSDLKHHKVIATTDKSLTYTIIESERGSIKQILPQIPSQFIKYFVEKNGKVDEIEVEYDLIKGGICMPNCNCEEDCLMMDKYSLKLTPNNEVIIHLPEEKMYSREEVIKIIKDSWIKGGRDVFTQNYNGPDKWIEENLK